MKFFFGWLVDQIKKQLKWMVALVSIAFGATTVPHLIHHYSKPSVEIGGGSTDSAVVQSAESPGSRAPASVNGIDENRTHPGVGFVPQNKNRFAAPDESPRRVDERVNPPATVSSSSASSVPFNRGGGYRAAPSSRSVAAAKDSGKSPSPLPSKTESSGGDDSVSEGWGASFNPTPVQSNASSTGQIYNPISGFTAVVSHSLLPIPGFEIGAGGGLSTGTHLRIQATVGRITTPAVQTGTGVIFISGMDGFAGLNR